MSPSGGQAGAGHTSVVWLSNRGGDRPRPGAASFALPCSGGSGAQTPRSHTCTSAESFLWPHESQAGRKRPGSQNSRHGCPSRKQADALRGPCPLVAGRGAGPMACRAQGGAGPQGPHGGHLPCR